MVVSLLSAETVASDALFTTESRIDGSGWDFRKTALISGMCKFKMCLSETYGTVRVGKHLSDMFPIKNCLKQGDTFSPLIFNFDLYYIFGRVQINQDGWKLNSTYQVMVYADDVYVLGERVYMIKKNTEALVAASKETG
jgi:hypothetical protein